MMEEEKNHDHGHMGLADDKMTDLAGKSLADALRVSFRLLSLFMVMIFVLFLFTGVSQIQTNERGIRLLFGKIQGEGVASVLENGLAWSLPEPIGQIEKIPTGERTLEINNFKPFDETKTLAEGLRPGWDGALLTGDRAMVHLKLTCNYRIGSGGPQTDAEMIMDYVSNIADPDEVVRSAVCNAAIHLASTLTADMILISGNVGDTEVVAEGQTADNKLGDAIRKQGQKMLDSVESGIWISSVKVESRIPPLAAKAAFDDVNTARQEKEAMKTAAIGEAKSMLRKTVGEGVWTQLVEDPTGTTSTKEIPLLKRYAAARDSGDSVQADKILDEIGQLLVSNSTKGEVSRIIEDAKRYNSGIRLDVEARRNEFIKSLPGLKSSPKLLVSRLWSDVKQKILSSTTIAKYYLTPGNKTIIRIGRDPKVTNRISEEFYKSQKGQQSKGTPAGERPR